MAALLLVMVVLAKLLNRTKIREWFEREITSVSLGISHVIIMIVMHAMCYIAMLSVIMVRVES